MEHLETQISEDVLRPEDIIKDPMGCTVYDMNDAVTGIAGYFTLDLCIKYIKTASTKEILALLQWSNRQPACIGLFFAKEATLHIFTEMTEDERVIVAKLPEFKEMHERYSELLMESNALSQWLQKSKWGKQKPSEVKCSNCGESRWAWAY